MAFRRARSDKDKEARVDEIIEASTEIYDDKKFNGLTFEAISKKINATRPLIYSYFSTKEEILVEILRRDVSSWTKDVKRTFKSKGGKYDVDEVAEKWTKCLMRHMRMVELYSMMHALLGNNVSPDRMEKIRSSISSDQESIVEQMSKVVPGMDHDSSSFFFDAQLSLAIGMFPTYVPKQEGPKDCTGMYGRSIRMLLNQIRSEVPCPKE